MIKKVKKKSYNQQPLHCHGLAWAPKESFFKEQPKSKGNHLALSIRPAL